jgi:hypothetical protein
MTVETGRLVESIVRVDDKDQFDAITFSHGLGQEQPVVKVRFAKSRGMPVSIAFG